MTMVVEFLTTQLPPIIIALITQSAQIENRCEAREENRIKSQGTMIMIATPP